MQKPELLKTHKGKTFDLVATTNGKSYSVKLKTDDWQTNEGRSKARYRLPRNYIPHHLKNLKRGCKLFLDEKFPGYKKVPDVYSGGSNLRPLDTKTMNDDSENAKNNGNRRNQAG